MFLNFYINILISTKFILHEKLLFFAIFGENSTFVIFFTQTLTNPQTLFFPQL